MKIRERGYVLVDAGSFTGFLELPMDGRRARGMSTRCDACHEDITTPKFVGAFRANAKNLKLCQQCGAAARGEVQRENA